MIQKNILLLFTFSLLLLNSCGNDTPKDKLNDIKKDASNFKDGVSSALAYNDGIISELTLLELKLMDLNSQIENGLDANYPEIFSECLKEQKRVHDVIYKVAPAGVGGAEFKNTAINYINAYGDLLDYFTPEKVSELMDESTNEMSEITLGFIEAFTNYENANNSLAEGQQIFARKNDSYIEEESVDLDELYEETK